MKKPTPEQLVAYLERSPLLKPLGPKELRRIASRSTARRLDAGEMLWAQGERSDAVAVVLIGRLEVARYSRGRSPVRLRQLSAGDLVGLSTVAGEPHTADVVAVTPAGVLVIPGEMVRDALSTRQETTLRVLAHLGRLVGELTDEVELLRHGCLIERVAKHLRSLARGRTVVEITQKQLAEHVGCSRERVSRVLKVLERHGAIRRGRGRIEILDLSKAPKGTTAARAA